MKCKTRQHQTIVSKWNSELNIPAALLLIIVPKCSFCILAYTSAIAMCSGKSTMSMNTTGIIVMSILSATILYGIVKNFRQDRSYWALLLVCTSLTLLWITALVSFPTIYHLLGSGLLFFGIWVNGSFLAFRNQIKQIVTMNQNLKSDL